ncbi:class I SAM-dependent methyltransferase [Flavobacteriaceae bacterium 3-367]|uniref:class I SAM-dependent methyltransferase n=1 Tax=Eudoraea algarum TaxID=3417568 RepID=UPI0032889C8C
MKQNFDIHRDIWGPYMTMITNLWAESVFKSINRLQELDIHLNNTLGTLPGIDPRTENRPRLTEGGIFLRRLHTTPGDKKKVRYFDLCADEYELATHKFKSRFLDRAFEILETQVENSSYILDAACGSGHEMLKLRQLVPQGEVIGLDLSEGMIKRAYRNAKLQRQSHVGFYQADINDPPPELTGHFDLVFCNISLHYFETVENVFHKFHRLLRKKGKLLIIEPLGSATQKLSENVLKGAIPHFKRFYRWEEQKQLLETAGFTFQYWEEIQKDIGLTIAST